MFLSKVVRRRILISSKVVRRRILISSKVVRRRILISLCGKCSCQKCVAKSLCIHV